MAFVQGPYAEFASLPAPTTTKLVDARLLNFATRRYVYDDDGNPEGMDATAQRVVLAVSFGGGQSPRFGSQRDFDARRLRIEAALKELVDEGAIRLLSVTVEEIAAGEGRERVEYVNLKTQREHSVTRLS